MSEAAATKSTTAIAEIIGPWMKSILNVATLAGAVYAVADENRRARLEGRQVKPKKPKTPLEEVMSEVGLEVPDLEGLMTKLLGGGPEANQRAAEIINSRDQAQLFREYLIRFATGQPPPSDPASTATPQPAAPATPPLASEASAPAPGPANSPPHVAQPRAHAHAGVPHGFGPPHHFVPPQGYGMPPQGYGMPPQGYGMPPHGFVPPQGFGMPPHGFGMPYGYGYPQPSYPGYPPHAAAGGWGGAPEPPDYLPELDRFGKGPPPGWTPAVHRPPAPPPIGHARRPTPRPAWTTYDKLPTRARTSAGTSTPRPTPKSTPAAPLPEEESLAAEVATTVAAAELTPTEASATRPDERSEDVEALVAELVASSTVAAADRTPTEASATRADERSDDLKVLIVSMTAKLEAFERSTLAKFNDMASDLKEALLRLDEVEREVKALKAERAATAEATVVEVAAVVEAAVVEAEAVVVEVEVEVVEAAVVETAVVEAAVVEAAMVEAVVETEEVKAAVIEAAVVETAVVEAAVVEAAVVEAEEVKTAVVEAAVVEAVVVEAVVAVVETEEVKAEEVKPEEVKPEEVKPAFVETEEVRPAFVEAEEVKVEVADALTQAFDRLRGHVDEKTEALQMTAALVLDRTRHAEAELAQLKGKRA